MKISIEKTSMFLLVKKISLKEGTSIQEIFRTKGNIFSHCIF